MKTITQLNSEIDKIVSLIKDEKNPLTKSKIKSLKSKISQLRQCIRYLETNPSQTLTDSEIVRLRTKLSIIDGGFNEWCDSNPKKILNVEKPRKVYNQEMKVAYLNKQLKTLKYLNS